jgi:hypothetical protein
MIRKLKIIDSNGSIDALYVLAYVSLIVGVVNSVSFPFNLSLLITLFCVGLITYRDEVLRAKETPIDEIQRQFEKLKGELSELQITVGMRR